MAQRRARRKSAYTEAIAFSKKGVACLEKLPSTVEMQKRIIDARVTLGNNCFNLDHYAEARDAVAPVFDLVHQLDYRRRLPAINVIMTAYLIFIEERPDEAEVRRYLMEAQRLALEEKDYLSLWNAYWFEGVAHGLNCEFAEGEACYLRIMEMSKAAGNLMGLEVVKFSIATQIYAQDGRIDAALKCGQEALQFALQADDLFLKGGAYLACGGAFLRKGLFPEAEENLTLAIELNQKTDAAGRLMLSFANLGLLRFEKGRYQEAQECCDGLIGVYERERTSPSAARLAQILKSAAGVRGHLNPALDAVLNFDLQEIRMRSIQGMAGQAMGEIYLYIDDGHIDEAEVWIRKAIEINQQNQMPWDLARAYALYSEFFKKKHDPTQAREKLSKAIDLMRGCGADGWVKKYEEELAII